jgi:hypothetical protein
VPRRTLPPLAVALSLLAFALVFPLVLPLTEARADSPPMPPCPPGWEQRGAYSCVEPFKCPNGWKLAEGPRCVPWECKEDRDCNWKGTTPCVAADLCYEPGGDHAQRVCDASSSTSNARCPSGLSCRSGKLCASGGLRDLEFRNWEPAGKTPAPSASASSTDSAAPAPSGDCVTGAPKSPAPRKGGCGSCAIGARESSALAIAATFAAIVTIIARRKKR